MTLPLRAARAIMGSRQEAIDSLDYFPTPPWSTRALLDVVLPHLGVTSFVTAWEPACGEGHMAEVLRETFARVHASDVYDYGYGDEVRDFLGDWEADGPPVDADWIITNPPYHNQALAFVKRALDLSRLGAAVFVRSQWAVEGIERYARLFSRRPPTVCAFFTERVPLCKGRWDPNGSTATAYCWLVWLHGAAPRPTFWIPPGQRVRLTKPDDRARFTASPVIKATQEAA